MRVAKRKGALAYCSQPDNGIYVAILETIRLFPDGLTSGKIGRYIGLPSRKARTYLLRLTNSHLVNRYKRDGQYIYYIKDTFIDKGEEYTYKSLRKKMGSKK